MADDVSLSVGLDGAGEVTAAVERLRRDFNETSQVFARFMRAANDEAREFQGQLNRTGASLERTAVSASALGNVIANAVSAAFRSASNFIQGAIKSNVEWAASIKDMAEATGATIDQVQLLTTAAKLEGESIGKVEQAFTSLTQKITQAREGSKSAQEAFAKLKLDPAQFRTSQEAIDKVFAAIKELPDGMDKTAVASELFGRRLGASMVQIIEATDKAAQVLKDFGVGLTTEQVEAIDAFKKSLDLASVAMEAIGRQIVVELAPALQFLVTEFLNVAKEGGGVKTIAESVGEAFRNVTGIGMKAAAMFLYLGKSIGGAAAFLAELPGALARGFSEGGIQGAISAFQRLQSVARDMKNQMEGELEVAFGRANKLMENDLPRAAGAAGRAAGNLTSTLKAKAAAVKDLLAPLRRMKESLEEQIATFGMSEAEAAQWKVTHGELGKIAGANAEAIRGEVVAMTERLAIMKRNKEQAEAVREAQKREVEDYNKRQQAQIDFVNKKREETETFARSVNPLKEYLHQVERIQEMHQKWGLELEDTRAAMMKAAESYQKAIDAADPMKEMFDELIRAVEGFGKKFTENITDFLVEGKLEIGNFAKEVHRLITNMLINTFVTKPIQDWVTSMITEMQRGEGAISSLFGGFKANSGFGSSFLGNIFGGGGAASFATAPAGAMDFAPIAGMFQHGGMIPAGFSGIVGEAGPELVQGPSKVTPMDQLGGSTVNVTNNFHVSGPMDRRSQEQMAARAGDSVNRAVRKNR